MSEENLEIVRRIYCRTLELDPDRRSAIGTGDIFELNVLGTIIGIIAAVGLIAIVQTLGIGEGRPRRA
jgi:hypothetical protein